MLPTLRTSLLPKLRFDRLQSTTQSLRHYRLRRRLLRFILNNERQREQNATRGFSLREGGDA